MNPVHLSNQISQAAPKELYLKKKKKNNKAKATSAAIYLLHRTVIWTNELILVNDFSSSEISAQ